MDLRALDRVSELQWRMQATAAMRVPVVIYADEGLLVAWRGDGGWGPGGAYGRLYDARTVVTIRGAIVDVRLIRHQGMSPVVHILVKTDSGILPVHLGPSWFVLNQKTMLKVGDRIEVRGSRIRYDGRSAIIAASVTKSGFTLLLRDCCCRR